MKLTDETPSEYTELAGMPEAETLLPGQLSQVNGADKLTCAPHMVEGVKAVVDAGQVIVGVSASTIVTVVLHEAARPALSETVKPTVIVPADTFELLA